MARAWLLNSKSLAMKVKNLERTSVHQLKDCETNLLCPNCLHHYLLCPNCNITEDWPGLPLGAKFDPTDAELLKHLAAKCGVGSGKPHQFINDFIPTIEGENGICYAHPKNLPGARKDGGTMHFFHRTMNAYATGQRKRRRVQDGENGENNARWHKTGKTKCVVEKGIQLGFKKIMVLYKSSKRGSKENKSNWVMHQYHLGLNDDEKDGEYVVSKIFYQLPKCSKKKDNSMDDSGAMACEAGALYLPQQGQSFMLDNVARHSMMQSMVLHPGQLPLHDEQNTVKGAFEVAHAPGVMPQDITYPTWLAGESLVVDFPDLDDMNDSFLRRATTACSSILVGNSGLDHASITSINSNVDDMAGKNGLTRTVDLENLALDNDQQDIDLTDLHFGSNGWLDQI